MDQRVKGGTPPATNLTLDPSSASEDSEQDLVAEKKKRCDGESRDVGKKEEEKKGAGRKRETDKGAVLELLIEGRCGSSGQQQLQLAGREATCPEGNVRFRIGLQEKRTKKPPKILESYICKPTIRTYQRQGRGGLLRGDSEGGLGQQTKTSSVPDDSAREQRLRLDVVQATSKQTASAASPPLAGSLSSLSSPSSSEELPLSSTLASSSTPASVPTIPSQGTKSAKQVPVKLADKTEVNPIGSSERSKKEKPPSVNGQSNSAGHKSCSPKTDQAASTVPSTPCTQTLSASECSNEDNTTKKSNGSVRTPRQTGLSNGNDRANVLGTSSKVKAGKHSSSSSVSSVDSSTRPQVSSGSHKESSLSKKASPYSASSPSVATKPQSSPTVDQSQDQNPTLEISLEKKKDKKTKKERHKDKKSKRHKLESDRAKGESKEQDDRKKKKEKGRDGKTKHAKEKAERHRADDGSREEQKADKGRSEKKKDKAGFIRQKSEDSSPRFGETVASDKNCKSPTAVGPEEEDDSCGTVKPTEPRTSTGDNNKSKEPDNSKQSTVPQSSQPSCSAPPSLPAPSARAPVSPPSFPPEQDSRPLKKRKARRPSWTKLVHRAHRAENHEAPADSQHNSAATLPQNPKTSPPANACFQQTDSHPVSSSSNTNTSPLASVTKPASPKHPTSDPSSPASAASARKRGRPKSHSLSFDEPPPRLSLSSPSAEESPLGCNQVQKAPAPEPSPRLQCAAQSSSSPKKRGRPPKRHLPEEHCGDVLSQAEHSDRNKDFHTSDKTNRLKLRRMINFMKKRKKRRLNKVMLTGYVGKEGRAGRPGDGETPLSMCKSIEATTVHTLSALSSSFGSKLGPQINVSKRGTIYMGKRRGRKPKVQTPSLKFAPQSSAQSSLFTNLPETSLFSSSQPPPPHAHSHSHPFPSPSLTHSSGAQSPRSEGSITEPTSSLLFPHHFSLPSPSSSCTSPRPPSSSSLSSFAKKNCLCQGRHQFPFHQSSCKLSCPLPSLHHTAGSPSRIKDATPSPRSESHSEETLPSDSGIGTDNNSVCERGELRGSRGIVRLGQGSGVMRGAQRQHTLDEHPSPVSSPPSHTPRHTNLISSPGNVERHRDRHRHRRRDYDCPSSCACVCPCPGHNNCTHSDYYPCLGHNALKRQKTKHKKKHQQLQVQDPEFVAELEDMIGQFNEVHIGKRSWLRAGAGQGFDGGGSAAGGRRHHSSAHPLRSNIFRINLNGFYSPHPSTYPPNPSLSPQSFFPCQSVHCSRKPERRQCGCPSKFQETIENMGFYGSYPPPTTLYHHHHHLPGSYPLPSPHQYAAHQPHHAHYLLNPARFHRRRSRLLREGALGGEVEGAMGGGSGCPHLSSGFTSSLSCGCRRNEHKRKHKHRHRPCERDMDEEEELHGDEEDDSLEREAMSSSKHGSGFVLGQGNVGKQGKRGLGSVLSKESPWLFQNRNSSFTSAAASSSSSSSLSPSAERYRHMSLTSLGLGSSHLSSFGGGWGALSQSQMKAGSLGGPEFRNSNPSWRGFAGEQHTGRPVASDEEDKDEEEAEESHLYGASPTPSPSHTNLFTSAAMAAGGRCSRSGLGRSSGQEESDDRSLRRDVPTWRDRRQPGVQGDSRSQGQQKSLPTPGSLAVKSKRRPGRPRKHPLPFTASSPTRSPLPPSLSSLGALPGHHHNIDGREAGGRREDRAPERDGGHDAVQQVTELDLQAKKKRGQKRKQDDSPCHQSVAEFDALPECLSPSDGEQASSQPIDVQEEEERDEDPAVKTYLRAGLYSDDYKTTDPSSAAQHMCRENLEYTPGEHEYTLLPAPIHVGKYLRLKRINFQLPYEVMWLWQHNQLYRQPAVPLKRKRRYCRLKERTISSHQMAERSFSDIASLFPHLDMAPLSSTERSFVVKQRVFLVRNWELVRDRQIRLRIERERERERERDAEGDEDRDYEHPYCDGASGDDSHIKSDQDVGVEVTVISSDPVHQGQDTCSSLTASADPNRTPNGGEEGQRGRPEQEELCSREQRRRRLNDVLLTLQHS